MASSTSAPYRPSPLSPTLPGGARSPPPPPPSVGYSPGEAGPSRRYGPSASSPPVPPTTSLLSPHSRSTTNSGSQESYRNVAGAGAGVGGAGVGGWNSGLEGVGPEDDDYLHNPDEKGSKGSKRDSSSGTIFTSRGLINIGCLIIVVLGLITLFAGYPIISFYTQHRQTTNGAYNLGGINSTGQVPLITNFRGLIDTDTPASAMSRTGFDGNAYNLVFSDEFNVDGRTFYDGDDPYWTAVDFHYWPTGDYEWYDPSGATTKNGNLVITMNQENIHALNFKSAMLQSWNKLCFQYSFYIEVRVSLPGTPAVGGFWPGVWTMGNLGRPGYGATTEGTWPYSYDSCDIGTLPNQTNVAQTGPVGALTSGDNGGPISFLPGQRVSACTCEGEDHPGPDVSKGRAAPEIDILEAQTDLSIPRGQVSQSFQLAPFDDGYWPVSNTTPAITQYDTSLVKFNSYRGGTYQQALSSLVYVQDSVYQGTSAQFGVYGFEMYSNPNKRSDGYITWVSEGKRSWSVTSAASGPNSRMQIGQRLIPEEPMSMIINFGASDNFQKVDFAHLKYPAQMLVDYVRVYQRPDVGKMGCDPADHPTADYISRHANAYSNPNLTTWGAAGYTFPKNSLQGC